MSWFKLSTVEILSSFIVMICSTMRKSWEKAGLCLSSIKAIWLAKKLERNGISILIHLASIIVSLRLRKELLFRENRLFRKTAAEFYRLIN